MKQFEELSCLDNFMFNALVMQEDQEKSKKFCKILIERVLGIKVRILDILPQKMMQGVKPDFHGIQMDAFISAINEKNDTADVSVKIKPEYYDLEPNRYKTKSEPKRIRFYQSIIDTKIFKAGQGYEELPNVVVIMISDYDVLGADRMICTLKRSCVEVPELEYDDGQRAIVLYTDGKVDIEDEYSRKLSDMLHFLKDSSLANAKDTELTDIQEMLDNIKDNIAIGAAYMYTYDKYLHDREEGRIVGLEEGRIVGLEEGRIVGLEEGRIVGLEEGRIETRHILRQNIIDILKGLGNVSTSLEERINLENDINVLNSWIRLSAKSESVNDFETHMNM